MPLTPHEAFRVGFLLRCADEGLTPAQTHTRVEKLAGLLGSAAGYAGQAGGHLANLGLGMAVGVPVALGLGGGYLAHKATEDSLDEDDVKKRELIAELKHWARRAREQRRTRTSLLG